MYRTRTMRPPRDLIQNKKVKLKRRREQKNFPRESTSISCRQRSMRNKGKSPEEREKKYPY